MRTLAFKSVVITDQKHGFYSSATTTYYDLNSVRDHVVVAKPLSRIEHLTMTNTWQWIAAVSAVFGIAGFLICRWLPSSFVNEYVFPLVWPYFFLSLIVGYWFSWNSGMVSEDRLREKMLPQAYKDRGVDSTKVRLHCLPAGDWERFRLTLRPAEK